MKDVHDCPPGAVGGGFCRQIIESRTADTFTYEGTEAEVRQRCSDLGGTWL